MTRRVGSLAVVGITMLLALSGRDADAAALPCDVSTACECQITTAHNLGSGGVFTVDRTLHLFGSPAALRVDAGKTLALNVSGSVLMDPGSRISGDSTSGAVSGATITITASGPIVVS